jgi:hypothetical protein
MTAYNVVRMRVKPGLDAEYIAAHKAMRERFPGARKVAVIKTGDRNYCVIGEWSGMAALVKARPQMIGLLDSFRDMLEDLGDGLGVTDPVSGEAVVERSFAKAKPGAKGKPAAKRNTRAAKSSAKKQPAKKAKKSTRNRGR